MPEPRGGRAAPNGVIGRAAPDTVLGAAAPDTVLGRAAPETLLGFDFGIRRIGVAIGNTLTGDARALAIVDAVPVDRRFERIGALLVEINRRFGTPLPPEGEVEDLDPLAMPVDAEFRVGTMGLGWDAEAQNVVVELLEATDTELDASVILDDAEDGPDAVRVFLSPESARKFATRSQRVISAGRPPCPLCVEPLDPDGHVCVRTNGYRRGGPLAAGDDSEP